MTITPPNRRDANGYPTWMTPERIKFLNTWRPTYKPWSGSLAEFKGHDDEPYISAPTVASSLGAQLYALHDKSGHYAVIIEPDDGVIYAEVHVKYMPPSYDDDGWTSLTLRRVSEKHFRKLAPSHEHFNPA